MQVQVQVQMQNGWCIVSGHWAARGGAGHSKCTTVAPTAPLCLLWRYFLWVAENGMQVVLILEVRMALVMPALEEVKR